MAFLTLPTLMALWIISDAKYIDPLCLIKVSDSVHDAVFCHNHELILRLWYWASPNQTTNYTIRVPDASQTLHRKTLNDTGWKPFEIMWPRPASNLSIITTGTREKLDENPGTASSPEADSCQEVNTPQALHITSDNMLIWLNTDPQHLNEEYCEEAAHIVKYILRSNELIPSYTSEAVRLPGPDGNSREYDRRTAIIVILAIFLMVSLLSLAVICCYVRQQQPQTMAQYEAVKLGGSGPYQGSILRDIEEVPQ